MPPSPIELSLHSLLPALSVLPPDLINLAQSLLSQSKIKAAHLKPEEEVGRIYACCHIAADRLRSKHGFEVGRARPPVPPRVYGKLRGFLEGVLVNAGPRTPTGRRETLAERGDERSVGPKKTPESAPTSMRKRWAEARKAKNATPSAKDEGRDLPGIQDGLEAPTYAMPMIRELCKACDTSKAAPHVFTGLSVVLKEYGRAADEEASTPSSGRKRKRGLSEAEDNAIEAADVPGAVLVLFIAVVRRMYGAEKLMSGAHVVTAKKFAQDAQNSLPESTKEERYFDDALARFDLADANGHGKWLTMEWFDNVPEASSSGAPGSQYLDDDDEDVGDEEDAQPLAPSRKRPAETPLRRKEKHAYLDDEKYLGRAGLLPGLGTMFQPAVDWLSEDRIAEYERWKREIGRDLRATEQAA